jgi:tyrosyl-tRNA synthetase
MNIYEELEWRGLINDITDIDKFNDLMKSGIHIYCGVDPTADSLHVGHLLPLIVLRRFQLKDYTPVALMGGGTGRIGDPSGRESERQLLDVDTIKKNVTNISSQIKKILSFSGANKALLLNNDDWLGKMSMYEFLRSYGKFFNINNMIAKESVAARMEKGVSFTEFSYQILQAVDWLKMNESYKVNMQVGGSDQWGNITAGLDLIRKKNPKAVCVGLTVPLVTKSDGSKFGKTADKAIWLDAKKTSPYEFYQFFLNTSDADVINYLKIFTFLDQKEIKKIEKAFKEKPHERLAQKTLAQEMTCMIHSSADYERAVKISEALFSGDIKDLNYKEIKASLKGVPESIVEEDEMNIVDLLVKTKICSSKREAREFINNNSITINGVKINDVKFMVKKKDAFNQEATIIRRGKKNYFKVLFK